MLSSLHPMLNVAIRAARAAGAIINRAALDVESLRVSQKQVNDFVTEVDQASELAIIDTLLGAYPQHGILAEESGQTHGNPNADHVWIIDPLDGTTNFIHGYPFYCVSIALAVKGRIEQAVVYDPAHNDLFTATRGRGAFLNDRRMRVSKRIRMSEALLSTGFPFRKGDDFPTYMKMMAEMMPRVAGLRRPGAAALDLAYVAAGRCDGHFETGLKSWDVAAGSLLVTEAGGLIGNFTGEAEPDFLDQSECLAASPRIYAQLVPLLQPFSRHQRTAQTHALADSLPAPTDEAAPRRKRGGALSLRKHEVGAAHAADERAAAERQSAFAQAVQNQAPSEPAPRPMRRAAAPAPAPDQPTGPQADTGPTAQNDTP